VIRTKTVILATGAAGRLGLPASGYLFGTYENPTNAGDGYSLAYHAGAELSGIECFQINPLIKDYNGPSCAYVTGPFGGYTANAKGDRFIECDYWSGQMMFEFYRELEGGNGPVFLKMDHLADETISQIEEILHSNERPSRGRFHEGRGLNYRDGMVAYFGDWIVQRPQCLRCVGQRACRNHGSWVICGRRSRLRTA
jgi:succinate dehydrogenase/fumarate reductase flavoprotein subunit